MLTKITAIKEDIDWNNHVNYSVYLKWLRKAHEDFLKSKGFSFQQLRKEHNIRPFVRRLEIDYLNQVFENEEATISTEIDRIGNTSITYHQIITKKDILVCKAHVVLVFVDETGKPKNIPEEVKEKLV